MQETVTNNNDTKSLFSSYLELMDSREKQAQVERQLQEEKYLRRTQRIYELHERQRRDVTELRRCLEFVSQHAHVLESALRGGSVNGPHSGTVPLGAALVRQAATLQQCMAHSISNAVKIRHLLSTTHQHQMDNVLSKMERELSSWSAFLQNAVDATATSETLVDNLHNLIAEQRRCVREVSSSPVMLALTNSEEDEHDREHNSEQNTEPACSTPIQRN